MTESADVFSARVVTKPWGSEHVFAEYPGLYVGKIIHVHAGHGLSLQYHRSKTETITIVQGVADVDYGDSSDALESRRLQVGDTIHLPAGVVHRLTAVDDVVFAEVSTAAPGWEHDVERLEDRYGRAGTSAP